MIAPAVISAWCRLVPLGTPNTRIVSFLASIFYCKVLTFHGQVPSTINRVYHLVHPEKRNYPLNILAAFVLPLQGFWNAMVYIATSWQQCREAFDMACSCCCGRRQRSEPSSPLSLRYQDSCMRGGIAYRYAMRPEIGSRSNSKNPGAMSYQEVLALGPDADHFEVDAVGMAIRPKLGSP